MDLLLLNIRFSSLFNGKLDLKDENAPNPFSSDKNLTRYFISTLVSIFCVYLTKLFLFLCFISIKYCS